MIMSVSCSVIFLSHQCWCCYTLYIVSLVDLMSYSVFNHHLLFDSKMCIFSPNLFPMIQTFITNWLMEDSNFYTALPVSGLSNFQPYFILLTVIWICQKLKNFQWFSSAFNIKKKGGGVAKVLSMSEVSLAQKTKNRMFSLICGH
jgi:hypothetical protein